MGAVQFKNDLERRLKIDSTSQGKHTSCYDATLLGCAAQALAFAVLLPAGVCLAFQSSEVTSDRCSTPAPLTAL
jgi:hypothetical protein